MRREDLQIAKELGREMTAIEKEAVHMSELHRRIFRIPGIKDILLEDSKKKARAKYGY